MLVGALTIGAIGCGAKQNNTNEENRKTAEEIKRDNAATAETPTNQPAQTSNKKTVYPVTITTYGSNGEEITTVYNEAPKKVLAVYQGCVETMLALGLQDHLVATAGLDNEVPQEQKAGFSSVQYLDEFTPSLETVTMLEPDMIFSWGSLFGEKTLGDAKGWVDKGVNTYISTNTRPKTGEVRHARTLENEYQDILNIGMIFDVQDRAEALVQQMKDTISNTKKEVAESKEDQKVLILEYMNDSFTNYGASSLGGDMVAQLGATLANPDGADMGKEDIVATNPDVIFVVYMPYAGDDAEKLKQEKLDQFYKDDSLASLNAVKNKKVFPIMLSEMYASATRTMDGIVTFADGLYAEK